MTYRSVINEGDVFGQLKVEYSSFKNGVTHYICRCTCGNSTEVSRSNLLSNHTKSCGCLKVNGMKTHGMYDTKFYAVWKAMKQRCLNPKNQCYKNYGGRGIVLCEEWKQFTNFKHDMYENYLLSVNKVGVKNTSLDRINNNEGYHKENCRWVSRSIQSFNRRSVPNTKSGVRGVHQRKDTLKWEARIKVNGKTKGLGNYVNKEDAIQARREAELLYFPEVHLRKGMD